MLWRKAIRAMRAMRGNALETAPFQPYSGWTESFLKVLSNQYFQTTRSVRAKQVVTAPLQPYFGFHWKTSTGSQKHILKQCHFLSQRSYRVSRDKHQLRARSPYFLKNTNKKITMSLYFREKRKYKIANVVFSLWVEEGSAINVV